MKDLLKTLETTTTEIAKLEDKSNLKLVITKLNEVIDTINLVNTKMPKVRDRGPQSEHKMTEEDARSIMLGEHKDSSHKVAAESLGLSYGQVYSARNGYTFKTIYKEMNNS